MVDIAAYSRELAACRAKVRALITSKSCHPIMVRLAWHDSGTFDRAITAPFPAAGGANGSIRFDEEQGHGANAGLTKARGYLKPIKDAHAIVSWADLIQMASAEAIYLAGGPSIAMVYGRRDAGSCPKEGNLPDAKPPYHGERDAATHLRAIFHRMGFSDQEIVALSGAHTLGRAFKDRSGAVENGYGAKSATKYTGGAGCPFDASGSKGEIGMAGGKSWTKTWLKFDNSYFDLRIRENALAWFPTDAALADDAIFAPTFEKYATSQAAFFADYAKAHKKLSELGSAFIVPGGIPLLPGSKL